MESKEKNIRSSERWAEELLEWKQKPTRFSKIMKAEGIILLGVQNASQGSRNPIQIGAYVDGAAGTAMLGSISSGIEQDTFC